MDFSQVKSVTIPEGNVTKIEVGGEVVWEKGENWGVLTYTSSGASHTYFLRSESDFNALCAVGTDITFPDGTVVDKELVTKFEFGSSYPTAIPAHFLSACSRMNQPINLPSGIVSIGNNFLENCYAFNQPLTIPAGVVSLGSAFLFDCRAFNQSLIIPSSVTTIGSNFMAYADAFNKELQVPSTVMSIGNSFLRDAGNFVGPLYANTAVTPDESVLNLSLSTTDRRDPIYATGVTLTGTYANTWKQALPNYETTYRYRKLILG